MVDNSSFAGLTNLTNLVLRHNNISSLPPCLFLEQKHLRYLDVSGNNLNIIHNDSWICLNSLETLNITGNPVTEISPAAFAPLNKLTTVHIDLHTLVTFNITILNRTTFSKAKTPPKIVVEDVNSLPCNSSSCWLKKAEDKGLMGHYMFHGKVSRPQCSKRPGVFWDEAELNCSTGSFHCAKLHCKNSQMAIGHLRPVAIWGRPMCKHRTQSQVANRDLKVFSMLKCVLKCKIHGCKCCRSLQSNLRSTF